MLTKNVVAFFGSKTAAAKALKISQVAVTRWGDVVPEKRAARLEHITNGALKYDPNFYDAHSTSQLEEKLNNENHPDD